MLSGPAVRSAPPIDKVAESKLAGCYFTAGVDENGRPMGGTFEVDCAWKLE